MFGTAAVVGTNVYVDPYLFFDCRHDPRDLFDSRQQNANRLVSRSFRCGYNALLFGSSRTILLGDFEYLHHRVLNLSALNLVHREYGPYLKLYLQRCGPPETVILALDFLGSSSYLFGDRSTEIRSYINNAHSSSFVLKSLFSINLMERSLEKILRGFFGASAYREIPRNSWVFPHKRTYDRIYGNYTWDRDYTSILRSIRDLSPGSLFIIATTPVSEQLFEMMLKKGLRPQYERWLMALVEVFGEVRNCAELNKTTRNPRLFQDENHLWPSVAKRFFPTVFFDDRELYQSKEFGSHLDRSSIGPYLELMR